MMRTSAVPAGAGISAAMRAGLQAAAVLWFVTMLGGCSLWPGSRAKEAAEGPRERPLTAFEVRGVEGELAENIRAHVSIASKPCDAAPAYLRLLARRAKGEAEEALRAYGYYGARVNAGLDHSGTCGRAFVEVEPGERTTLGEVDVSITGPGAADPDFVAAVADHELEPGAGLHHGRYAAAKQLIERIALERGYLEGRFARHKLRVDPTRHTATVRIEYASGPRYALGEIRILQDPVVIDESLIRRFLDHTPGEPYNAAIVPRFYTALTTSEYFSNVEVRPLISAPEQQTIPIEITLSPGKKHKFRTGVGFSTDEGVRGRLNYQNRRLNARGHRLNGEVRASFIEQRVSADYQIPRAHPSNEWLSLQAGVRRENVDAFETVETQLGVADTKRRPWGWTERRFIGWSRQTFDIGDDNKTTNFVIPGVRWTKSRADDALFPSRGYGLDVEVRGAADAFLSDTSFVRTLLTAKAVRALPGGFRALLRSDLGASWVDDFDKLPPTERFFAGGDVSIRGFDIDELGPEDANGEVVGGRYLAVGSVEIEKAVADDWGVAAFVDAGNAYGGSGSSTGLRIGTGAGVRWYSPIGPVRLDVAHPLDDDTLVRIHVRIGPDL